MTDTPSPDPVAALMAETMPCSDPECEEVLWMGRRGSACRSCNGTGQMPTPRARAVAALVAAGWQHNPNTISLPEGVPPTTVIFNLPPMDWSVPGHKAHGLYLVKVHEQSVSVGPWRFPYDVPDALAALLWLIREVEGAKR